MKVVPGPLHHNALVLSARFACVFTHTQYFSLYLSLSHTHPLYLAHTPSLSHTHTFSLYISLVLSLSLSLSPSLQCLASGSAPPAELTAQVLGQAPGFAESNFAGLVMVSWRLLSSNAACAILILASRQNSGKNEQEAKTEQDATMTKKDLVKLYHEVKQEAAPEADKKVLRPAQSEAERKVFTDKRTY